MWKPTCQHHIRRGLDTANCTARSCSHRAGVCATKLRPWASGAATGDAADGKGVVISQRAAGLRPWHGEIDGGGAASLEWVYFYHKKRSSFKTARDNEHSALITQFQQLSTHGQLCFICYHVLPLNYFEANPRHNNILTLNVLMAYGVSISSRASPHGLGNDLCFLPGPEWALSSRFLPLCPGSMLDLGFWPLDAPASTLWSGRPKQGSVLCGMLIIQEMKLAKRAAEGGCLGTGTFRMSQLELRSN